MWGNNRKIFSLVMKILAGLLAVVLAVGVYYAYRKQMAKDAHEAQQYTAVYEEHIQKEPDVKQVSMDQINEEYQKDLAAVEANLPGFVCWGDTLTIGTTGGVSYPAVLQRLLNENICEAYNFRLRMAELGDFSQSRVDWSKYTVSIPVVNMGVSGESAQTVAGRCGAMPYLLYRGVTIPAECEPVDFSLTNAVGLTVDPLASGESGINDVTIAGVTGKLTRVRPGQYRFTRNEPGESVRAEAGTPVITACSDLYTDFIPVILIGTYSSNIKPEQYVSLVRAMVDHHASPDGRYLVIGPFTSAVSTSDTRYDQIEKALLQAFGENFINARSYFCSDGLNDAKMQPTVEDRKDIAQGNVPSSLRNPLAPEELNAAGYELLGKLLYARMDRLGWFEEVKDELGLERN